MFKLEDCLNEQFGNINPQSLTETMKEFERYLVYSNDNFGGISHRFRFPNGYEGSVICHGGSYGHEEGLWEVAVFREGENDPCYDTPVTNDVIGNLSDKEVYDVLKEIRNLPSRDNSSGPNGTWRDTNGNSGSWSKTF